MSDPVSSRPAAGRTLLRPAADTTRRPGGERVTVELSPDQVDQVVRAAAGGGSLAVLLSGAMGEPAVQRLRALNQRGLSRSLLAGLLVLACFPSDGGYTGVAQVAQLVGMNTSTTHRYIVTLAAAGLVERDPDTRRYRLAG